MRWVFKALALAVAFCALPVAAGQVQFSLDRLPVVQLLKLYYTECDQDGYVITSKGLDEASVVSAESKPISCERFGQVVDSVLRDAGFRRDVRPGPDIVTVAEPGTASEHARIPVDRSGWETLVYSPRYRDANDLVSLSGFLVERGVFGHRSEGFLPADGSSSVVADGGNGASLRVARLDRIVFAGPPSEVKSLRDLWSQLDTPVASVEIRLGVYEFGSGATKGSALAALAQVLGSSLRVDLGQSLAGDTIEIDVGDFSAVLSAIDRDNRFNYVSQPRVIAQDGMAARFFAGEDVRVTGGILVDKGGNPIQSVESLSAGLTLEVTPHVRGDVVSLDLYQAVSQFTKAGDAPSILRRDLRTAIPAVPGRVYVVAGMDSTRAGKGRERFLGMPVGRTHEESKGQLVVLLTVNRIDG